MTFAAPESAPYFALIRHWHPDVGGCGTQYDVVITEQSTLPPDPPSMPRILLPLIQR